MATAVQTGAERVEWDLSDLYAAEDDPALAGDLERAKADAASFNERYAGRIGELTAAELADATAELERVVSVIRNITLFARLRFDADTADESRGRFLAKMEEELTALENDFGSSSWSGPRSRTSRPRRCSKRRSSSGTPTSSGRSAAFAHLLSEPEERVGAEESISGITAGRLYSDLLSQIRIQHDGEDLSIDQRATGCA